MGPDAAGASSGAVRLLLRETRSGARRGPRSHVFEPPSSASPMMPITRQVSRVLLIEDSDRQRRFLSERLEGLGYSVSSVAGGEEGLRLLRELDHDIVLLDVGLPEPDGWRTLELIRSMSEVPVILLTIEPDAERLRALEGGADDYVAKPVAEADVAARMEAILRRRSDSRVDLVTRLPNRSAFDEELDSLVAQRRAQGVALVLFELEGGEAGDDGLRRAAGRVRRELRGGDHLFRIGRETFAVLVLGGLPAGFRAAERLRATFERKNRGPNLTAGVAAYEAAGGKDGLFGRAGLALAAAKRAGRNLVVPYDAELERLLASGDPPTSQTG